LLASGSRLNLVLMHQGREFGLHVSYGPALLLPVLGRRLPHRHELKAQGSLLLLRGFGCLLGGEEGSSEGSDLLLLLLLEQGC
jgi:hypothetical protein